jgi:hypothetical protein
MIVLDMSQKVQGKKQKDGQVGWYQAKEFPYNQDH